MKIIVEIPTWLGDAVMCTPAIENLIENYPQSELTIFGSSVAVEVFRKNPYVKKIIVDNSKKDSIFFRIKNLIKLAEECGRHDLGITFRNSFFSGLFLKLTKTPERYGHRSGTRDILFTKTWKETGNHQVEKYNNLVNRITGNESEPGNLHIYSDKFKYIKPSIGINPGASYGSAKRWYPERFAEVSEKLSGNFDIIIFGGPKERDIAEDIENILIEKNISNYKNLCGLTSVQELIEKIAGLSLFVTNDSGPMHVAAAMQVPTVCIFGPTDHKDTCQWKNRFSIVIRNDMHCSPCLKRKCPLGHHECMKSISTEQVIRACENLLEEHENEKTA